jgi:dienelactone hydrolase
MNRKRSPIRWSWLGILATALVGLGLAFYLTGGFSRPGAEDESDYEPVIHISSQADLEAIRSELIAFLFGAQSLPAILPEITAEGVTVHLHNGFESRVTVYRPAEPNGALVIYHTGHEGYTWRDRAAIRSFVRAGYLVWQLDMPLTGANPHTMRLELPEAGSVVIRQHRQFAYLDEITPGSPLRYFVEPAIALVNQAEAQGYSDIFMVGLSGGGWTTQLAAAVDVRIDAAYPVAAGVPLGLRFDNPRRNWGDWEENLPELQRIAGFEDLSILGAAGRSQIQVLNQFDPCCYNEPHYTLYESTIQEAVEALGGHYAVYWARGEFLHRANPAAVQVILEDMQSRRTP